MAGPGGAPYVEPAQLGQYLPAATLSLATYAQQLQACLDATNQADSYMRSRVQLPLLAWDNDISMFTAMIAVYRLMSGAVGFAPQAGTDVNIVRNYQSAVGGTDPVTGQIVIGYFEKVQRQAIVPNWTPSIPVGQDPGHDAPQVSSQPQRGWYQSRGGRPVVGGF
jgi:phage gp36-like protein